MLSFVVLWASAGALPALMIATWSSNPPVRINIDVLATTAVGALIGPLMLPAALIWDWRDRRNEDRLGWP